jgi:redox-sensing transcriptional repressor
MSVTPAGPAQSGLRGAIPDATVSRLPIYHRTLSAMCAKHIFVVSSEELAEASGVTSAKLRKDLSFLGSYGTRGVGYDVEFLLYQIARVLGLNTEWPVVIAGVGNLGHALAGYPGFASRGFCVVGLFDTDVSRIGETIQVGDRSVRVRNISEMATLLAQQPASIGVIATPETAAQRVCDAMVANGVTSILNFAPIHLEVPEGVDVRRVDLATELQILAFHEQRKLQSMGTSVALG